MNRQRSAGRVVKDARRWNRALAAAERLCTGAEQRSARVRAFFFFSDSAWEFTLVAWSASE
jgi:hypothetical protein